MMIVAGGGFFITLAITSVFPASEYSFVSGLALAIFGVIIAIQIVLYSKVRKEIPK
jgi:hypothetical protein